MQLVDPRKFPHSMRMLLAGGIAAIVLFVVLGIVGQGLPTVFTTSGAAAAYWSLFAAFLAALLVSTTAGGIAWGIKARRRAGPLVFTSAVWLTLASFFIGIASGGFEAGQGETLWIACLVVGSVGTVAAVAGLCMMATRTSDT